MLCQSCNQKEANVHITKIINGVKTELHLCEDCAKQKNEFNFSSPFSFGSDLSFQNILDGFVEVMGGSKPQYFEEQKCSVCGTTFEDFRRTGFVGCGNCYKEFNKNIVPLIRRIHGNIHHTGKLPRRAAGLLKLKRRINNLKEELKMAVNNEEYEKAAKIRDEIKELEAKIKDQETRG